jgi:hypothetical protein
VHRLFDKFSQGALLDQLAQELEAFLVKVDDRSAAEFKSEDPSAEGRLHGFNIHDILQVKLHAVDLELFVMKATARNDTADADQVEGQVQSFW